MSKGRHEPCTEEVPPGYSDTQTEHLTVSEKILGRETQVLAIGSPQ